MSIKRLKSWLLAVGMQLSVASAALAQAPAYMPGIGTLDLFAQPDLTPYGDGSNQASGWFGSFEALSWATSNPRTREIGAQGMTRMVYSGNSTPVGPTAGTTLQSINLNAANPAFGTVTPIGPTVVNGVVNPYS